MPDRNRIRQALEKHGLGRIAAAIVDALQPGLELRLERVPAEAELAVGATKIGGSPDLLPEQAWPTTNGREMHFLAQIELADVAALMPQSPLPKAGLLSFFADTVSGAGQVHYLSPDAAALQRRPDPWAARRARRGLLDRIFAKEIWPYGQGYWPCRVQFRAAEYLHDSFGPHAPALEFRDEESDALFDTLLQPLAEVGLVHAGHRLLGAATPIQGAVEVEAELLAQAPRQLPWEIAQQTAKDWCLLLQLDSDERLGFRYGDGGSLYFLMRAADLGRGAWNEARCVAQCH